MTILESFKFSYSYISRYTYQNIRYINTNKQNKKQQPLLIHSCINAMLFVVLCLMVFSSVFAADNNTANKRVTTFSYNNDRQLISTQRGDRQANYYSYVEPQSNLPK